MNTSKRTTDSGTALAEIVERVRRISAENEDLVRQLADGEFRFRRLAKASWRVQEEERRNIALELHDGLGQVLTALINHLSHSAADGASREQALELAKSALREVRRMSRALRPSVLDDLGLGAALRWLARTTGETSGLDVAVELPDEDGGLDAQTETLVFRIVQEALTNAVRHAEASRARIVLDRQDGFVEVSVSDNGSGFDAGTVLGAADRGFGVRGMRDRAELFGGRLELRSARGEGTLVTLRVPEATT